MRSKQKYNYAGSEKFKADLTKHLGLILGTPFCWDLFKFFTEGRIPNLLKIIIELGLCILAYFFVGYSYGTMRKRDELYFPRINTDV